jgi:hypothetical protein
MQKNTVKTQRNRVHEEDEEDDDDEEEEEEEEEDRTYIRTYVYTYTHVRIRIHTRVYTNARVRAYVRIRMRIRRHARLLRVYVCDTAADTVRRTNRGFLGGFFASPKACLCSDDSEHRLCSLYYLLRAQQQQGATKKIQYRNRPHSCDRSSLGKPRSCFSCILLLLLLLLLRLGSNPRWESASLTNSTEARIHSYARLPSSSISPICSLAFGERQTDRQTDRSKPSQKPLIPTHKPSLICLTICLSVCSYLCREKKKRC